MKLWPTPSSMNKMKSQSTNMRIGRRVKKLVKDQTIFSLLAERVCLMRFWIFFFELETFISHWQVIIFSYFRFSPLFMSFRNHVLQYSLYDQLGLKINSNFTKSFVFNIWEKSTPFNFTSLTLKQCLFFILPFRELSNEIRL